MPVMLIRAGILLVTLVTCAVAQTEYEVPRRSAMQRLGDQLQAGELDASRRDLAAYVDRFPGDAVMQYNLACLDAVAGDTAASLIHLEDAVDAVDAGYGDLERSLHDPDLLGDIGG